MGFMDAVNGVGDFIGGLWTPPKQTKSDVQTPSDADFIKALQPQNTYQAPEVAATNANRGNVQNVQAPIIAATPHVGTAGVQTQGAVQGMTDAQKALALQASAAQGLQPSAAQLTGQQQSDNAFAQQMAAQNSGPFNPAAQRQLQMQAVNNQQALAANTGILRANEMANAQQQYANTAQGTAGLELQKQGLDQTAGVQDAQLKLQADLANQGVDSNVNLQQAQMGLQSQMANQGIDLQVELQKAAAGNAASMTNLQAKLTAMGYNAQQAQALLGAMSARYGTQMQNQTITTAAPSPIMSIISGISNGAQTGQQIGGPEGAVYGGAAGGVLGSMTGSQQNATTKKIT